jgi:hypothetical protein
MKCHTNVNSTSPTQLPHTFSDIVAILIHNHFESPNSYSILHLTFSALSLFFGTFLFVVIFCHIYYLSNLNTVFNILFFKLHFFCHFISFFLQ